MTAELELAGQRQPAPVTITSGTTANALDMLRDHAEMMSAAHHLAKQMVGTQMVPTIYRGKPDDATAAILYGAELGLNPIQSLQQVFPVHGQPAIYARTMAALLRARGYKFRTDESTDESVTVTAIAPDGETETATWDIARARRAGYLSNKKYESDPRAMLYAKCVAEVSRKLAPDVLLGIAYCREELELEPAPVRTTSERVTAAELLAGPGVADLPAMDADNEAEPDPAPPAADVPVMASTAEQRRVSKALDGITVTDKAGKLEYLRWEVGREVASAKEITSAEAVALAERLEDQAAAAAELRAALVADRFESDAEQLDWVRTAAEDPDLAAIERLSAEQARKFTALLTTPTTTAAEAADQQETEQP